MSKARTTTPPQLVSIQLPTSPASVRSAPMPSRLGASAAVMFLALASLGWPRSAFGQDKSADGGAFRSKVDLVSVYFTVRDDKKRLVSDLAQDSFSVSQDGQPQAIKFFAHHTGVILNVGVLLRTGANRSWRLPEAAPASP